MLFIKPRGHIGPELIIYRHSEIGIDFAREWFPTIHHHILRRHAIAQQYPHEVACTALCLLAVQPSNSSFAKQAVALTIRHDDAILHDDRIVLLFDLQENRSFRALQLTIETQTKLLPRSETCKLLVITVVPRRIEVKACDRISTIRLHGGVWIDIHILQELRHESLNQIQRHLVFEFKSLKMKFKFLLGH